MVGILRVGRLLAGTSLGSTAFTPASLFAASEPGGWYDPSDLTTLYQDAAGTTPVTAVEQPVGLVLDKSRGLVLGSEKWTASPTLAANWSGSGGTYTSNGGTGFITVAAIGSAYLTVGKVYKTSFTVSNVTAGSVSSPYDGEGTNGAYKTANGTYERIFRAAADGLYIYSNGFAGTVSNITVKEVTGAHLSQSTAAARPVLSARVNLLTRTEEFDNAAWGKVAISVSANTTVAPGGAQTADTITCQSGSNNHYFSQAVSSSFAASTYAFTVRVKYENHRWFLLQLYDGTNSVFACFDLLNKVVGSKTAGVTSSIEQVSGTDFYTLTLTSAVLAGSGYVYGHFVTTDRTSVQVFTAAGTEAVTIWGADLRPANAGVGLPAYQRVGAATAGSSTAAGNADYDTTGFPLYLRGDGVDDHLLGPNIGDLITVSEYEACVGARFNAVTTNTSPWVNQSLVTDVGGFVGIGAARSTGVIAAYNYDATADEATVAMVAPSTIVLQQRHAGGNIVISTNGGTEASTASGNTLNVSTSQVFRASSSVYTNGHIYGIVIRSTAFTAAERVSIRDWMNSKTKAF